MQYEAERYKVLKLLRIAWTNRGQNMSSGCKSLLVATIDVISQTVVGHRFAGRRHNVLSYYTTIIFSLLLVYCGVASGWFKALQF